MKFLLSIITFAFFFTACKQEKDFKPRTYLTEKEEVELKSKLVYYIAKLPKGANHETKGDTNFIDYYKKVIDIHELVAYYIDKETNQHYFMIKRKAPSLYDKYVGICGVFNPGDGEQGFASYKELFWTFKMNEDVFKEKAFFLFDYAVNGGDLTKYYPQNTYLINDEEWIEFPDQKNRFLKNERRWETFDPALQK